MNTNKKVLGVFQVAMLITVSIDSIRNLPATALFGSVLPFFFIMGVIFFLLPTGLVSAELAASNLKQPGIYGWVKAAMGKHVGILAIWLQWVNTLVWYPTILAFIAGTFAYLIDPHLAAQKGYLISVILIVFWAMTLVNLKGIQTSARVASYCGVIGMLLPMGLLFVFAAFWLFGHHSLQVHFNSHDILPDFKHTQSWLSLTAIITSLLGMELATVHVRQVENSKTVFPKAILIATAIIFGTIILGSLSIAFVIPSKQIHLVDGIMQTFAFFLHTYHISFLLPVFGILILIGSVGGMTNWIISPAKGLLQATEDNYLPRFFTHQNKHGVANRVLITQAIVTSLLCIVIYILPSVNASYWLLTDLSTEMYLFMYVLMFIAALILKRNLPANPGTFHIPFGKFGFNLTCIMGLVGSLVAIVVGFIPPTSLNIGSPKQYEFIFVAGLIIMLSPMLLLYLQAYLRSRKAGGG